MAIKAQSNASPEAQLAAAIARANEAEAQLVRLNSRAALNVRVIHSNAKGEPYKAGPIASFSNVPGAARGNLALRGDTFLWLCEHSEEIRALLIEEGMLLEGES